MSFGKSKSDNKQEAPAIKQTPLLSQVAEYPLYRKTLEERMAGIGTGYDPKVLSEATNPYAKQMRSNFKQIVVPTISGEASARGLGRSTIPVNRIAIGSQGVEEDIGTKIASLQLANEERKSLDKTGATSGYGGLMTSDYNAMLNNISSQNAQAQAAADASNYNRAYSQQQQNQLFGGLANIGTGALLGGITGGPMGALYGGVAGAGGFDPRSYLAAKAAMVNY